VQDPCAVNRDPSTQFGPRRGGVKAGSPRPQWQVVQHRYSRSGWSSRLPIQLCEQFRDLATMAGGMPTESFTPKDRLTVGGTRRAEPPEVESRKQHARFLEPSGPNAGRCQYSR